MTVVSPDDPSASTATARALTGPWPAWLVPLAYAVAIAAVLYPLAVVSVPPLVDYPNHLARLHILANINTDPSLQTIYQLNWAILPNLAMDIVAQPLAKAFGAYDAGKLFVGLTLVLMMSGTAVLHRVLHGKFGVLPLAAALFIHNLLFFFGFLNFLFSAGLVFFALAGWISMASGAPWKRALLFALIAPALFISHLFAFCVYGLFIVTFEAQRFFETKDRTAATAVNYWAPVLVQFLFPGILYLMSPTGGGETITLYGSLKDKIYAIAAPTTFYGTWADRVLFVTIGILILRGFFSRKLEVAKEIRLPLLVFCVVAIAMPSRLLNTWGADLRLPVVIVFLFVAGVKLRPVDRRLLTGMVFMLVALFAIRTHSIAQGWQEDDRRYAEFRDKTRVLRKGARVLMARAGHDANSPLASVALNHVASLAIISRSIFTPGFFSDPRKQPVGVRPPYQAIDMPHADPVSIGQLRDGASPEKAEAALRRDLPDGLRMLWPFWAHWPRHYDYVIVIREQPLANPVPSYLTRVSAGSFFDIYRVVK